MDPRPSRKPLDYETVLGTEGKLANEIMQNVIKLGLPLKLDELTEGLGNCFPVAIIQQLRRPEIQDQLKHDLKRLGKIQRGHTVLRMMVKSFITQSEHYKVIQLWKLI